jgi:hypothetical protein
MMTTLELWKNGNAAVAVTTYGENSTLFNAERGVYDGTKWQWRTISEYRKASRASKRIAKERESISQGWTAATWQREI